MTEQNRQMGWPLWAGAVGVFGLAFYQGLAYRRYALSTSKWIGGASLRIVFVSDLHSLWHGGSQSKILAMIQDEQPDYLLLGGDIVDERWSFRAAEVFLRGASGIAPCYYVTGNHEYRTGQVAKIKSLVRDFGVSVLSDQFVQIRSKAGPLILAGCEDPAAGRVRGGYYFPEEAFHKAFQGLGGESGYTVLLSHRPECIDLYQRYGFDLVLSGHAHGGQVRIPWLLNGLYASNQGLLPRYGGGCYRHGATSHIVGRGVAAYRRIPRVFNPPELVTVDITGL